MTQPVAPASKDQTLALELTRHLVHRDVLSFPEANSLLQQLLPGTADPAKARFRLLCLLLSSESPEAASLARRLNEGILAVCLRDGQERRSHAASGLGTPPRISHLPAELPATFGDSVQILPMLQRAVELERDRLFLDAVAPDLEAPRRALSRACALHAELLASKPVVFDTVSAQALWTGFRPPEGLQLPASASLDQPALVRARLDRLAAEAGLTPEGDGVNASMAALVSWPGRELIPSLLKACTSPVLQAYAMHALASRTGINHADWPSWSAWLGRSQSSEDQFQSGLAALLRSSVNELRIAWLRVHGDASMQALIDAVCVEALPAAQATVQPAAFVRRWERDLAPQDVARLLSLQGNAVPVPAALPPPPKAAQPPPLPTPEPPPLLISRPAAVRPPPVVVSAPLPEPEEPRPSLWDDHIRPFVAANWYMLAGLLLVVAGASLLAYFTWDKSVLVRYLFLPALLAGFTAGLAELGLRLGRRHVDLQSMGTFLLGGAVCLLPVNFMVLCRAGEDPTAATWLLPALLLYAGLGGYGLWRWCGSVRPELRLLQAVPLLAVNLLAVLGDMPGVRQAVSGHREALLPATITAAVLLLLAMSNRFLRLVLTRELLENRIVPWFFGATLAATTAQVALWRHFHQGIRPHPSDYALAAVLVGATLLRWERRACELRAGNASYGGESFLGYAALLLGVLLSAGNEWLRVVTLLLVGVIWLIQAPRRPGVLHHWIGVTFCLLAGSSVGVLSGFPKSASLNLLPELGLALALAAGVLRVVASRIQGEDGRLREVAHGIQPPILLLTAVVAVLTQYNLHSSPLQAGLVLCAVAGVLAVRATVESRGVWLEVAAACSGLALPYLGCADMLRYDFSGNSLALGFGLLGALWFGVSRVIPGVLWKARVPRIVSLMGLAGLAGLVLRLALGGGRPELALTDALGVLVLAVGLAGAAWAGRLRVPAAALAVLLAVLLPLFRLPSHLIPGWFPLGTGLASATWALALSLVAFPLRRLAVTQTRFSVFQAPLLGAAAWLVLLALSLQFQSHALRQEAFVASLGLLAFVVYVQALFWRRVPGVGPALWQASWCLLAGALALACSAAGCSSYSIFQYTLLWTGCALLAALFGEWIAARRLDWAWDFLVRPRLALLSRGSFAVGVLLFSLLQVTRPEAQPAIRWLALFTVAQLAWHALRGPSLWHGTVLFLVSVSASVNFAGLPGEPGLLVWWTLALLVFDLVRGGLRSESAERVCLRFAPLHRPFLAGASILAPVLVVFAFAAFSRVPGGFVVIPWSDLELLGVIAACLLAARAQGLAPLALPALALAYVVLLEPCPPFEFVRPWHLALLGLFLGGLPFLGRALQSRAPWVLRGKPSHLSAALDAVLRPSAVFLFTALGLVVYAALGQLVLVSRPFPLGLPDPVALRLLAPYSMLVVCGLCALYWRKVWGWGAAALLLPLVNLFAFGQLWWRDLLASGLSDLHVCAIALLATASFYDLARILVRRVLRLDRTLTELPSRFLGWGACALSGLVLLLLVANYLGHPDLTRIGSYRYLIAGLLTLGAGLQFRFEARRPEYREGGVGEWLEAAWHVALGLTLWCAALLVPELRTPEAALHVLSLPVLVLWFQSEWFLNPALRKAPPLPLLGTRFRTSASAFALLLLALFVFRLPLQMLLFPVAPLDTALFHSGAPSLVVLGLVLLRLRGLGGAPWTAQLGGQALMAGLFLTLTWFPGFSPFEDPMAAGWLALALAHLLILLSYQHSPLRSMLQFLGALGAEEWHAHRRQWGQVMTLVLHLFAPCVLAQAWRGHALEATPFLFGLASVLIHQALVGAPFAKMYWGFAGAELFLALHFDFMLPSAEPGLIPARFIVWVLLLPWLAAVIAWPRLRALLEAKLLARLSAAFAAIVFLHLLYHGPATGSGLLIAAGMTAAILLTPSVVGDKAYSTVSLVLLLGLPAWFAYFGILWLGGDSLTGFRPLLAASAALLVSGFGVRHAGLLPHSVSPEERRLLNDARELCLRFAEPLSRGLLGLVFAVLAVLTALHPVASSGGIDGMLLLVLVWLGAAMAWFREGRLRDGELSYVLSLLCLGGAWVVLRRLLFLHSGFWTYEYDVWLSLGVSIAFSAAKRLIVHERPAFARTLTWSVWFMPALQAALLLWTRMDADLTLVVIGVQAMLFAWHGGGRRESPYNGIAMLGFVGFVCLLFWSKLDLRCLQAYTIPLGLAMLALLWLFGRHVDSRLRQVVRGITLAVMLGSCGYYALLDDSYPVGFHLTMILLSLVLMGLGPLLRVQLYLFLGFAGLATDLIALVARQFSVLDRSARMVGVGSLLLLLGVAVVGGAVFFRTHHEQVRERVARLRGLLARWE